MQYAYHTECLKYLNFLVLKQNIAFPLLPSHSVNEDDDDNIDDYYDNDNNNNNMHFFPVQSTGWAKNRLYIISQAT